MVFVFLIFLSVLVVWRCISLYQYSIEAKWLDALPVTDIAFKKNKS